MNRSKRLFFLLVLWFWHASGQAFAQQEQLPALLPQHKGLFTTPKSYVAKYTAFSPLIDGHLADEAWQTAPWTELFVDIEGDAKPAPAFATRVKMLWNDSCFFIAAYLQEPHVWATLKNRDAIVYYDNDFEVFIDPHNTTHQYYEIEANAFNTVMDLLMPKPYRNGAGAVLGFDVTNLQTAVQVQGTINDPADTDSSWTIEMAVPFRSLFVGNRWRPPAEGALWRINFSRVQWQADVVAGNYVKRKNERGVALPEDNWVWSPQGLINMHYPERWGYLLFTKKEETTFSLPYDESRKPYLWLLYYRQKEYHQKHRRYASSLAQLGFKGSDYTIAGTANKLKLEATSHQFMAYLTDSTSTITINEEGRVQKINARL